MAELLDSFKHEPDDCDLNDDQLFTDAAQADKPLDFNPSANQPTEPSGAAVRWQARRWH
jgi:hypothetical protein